MSISKAGDYNWRQISIWESTPEKCIEKYITSETGLSGKQTCIFYLTRVKSVSNDGSWKNEVVISLNDVPEEILKWRNPDYRVKG